MKQSLKKITLDFSSTHSNISKMTDMYFLGIDSLLKMGKTNVNDLEVKNTQFFQDIQQVKKLELGGFFDTEGKKLSLILDIAATSSSLKKICFKPIHFNELKIDLQTIVQKICNSDSSKEVYFESQENFNPIQKDKAIKTFDERNYITIDKNNMLLFISGTLNTIESNKNSEFALPKDILSQITSLFRFSHINHNLSNELDSSDSSSEADFELPLPIENDVGIYGDSAYYCTIL
jgi:hypothetical protein